VPFGPDLIEGLGGPGLRAARDLGLPELEKAEGWRKLLDAMRLQIMPLARLEAKVCLSQLVTRYPNIRRGNGEVDWIDALVMRGPSQLPIFLA
jgi:hypothetical protein